MRYLLLFICICLSQAVYAETGGWVTKDGKPAPDTDNMKSKNGFGGWLIITPDDDWEAKLNTSPETVPQFQQVTEVKYGQRIAILTFYINPKTSEAGDIRILCDLNVLRPDGSSSVNEENVDCAVGKIQGNPRNVRLVSAVLKFIGEKSDLPGEWKVNVTLKDMNRDVEIPLNSKFILTRE
jgi:hypothetical protein